MASSYRCNASYHSLLGRRRWWWCNREFKQFIWYIPRRRRRRRILLCNIFKSYPRGNSIHSGRNRWIRGYYVFY
jgi:hypothetical protein